MTNGNAEPIIRVEGFTAAYGERVILKNLDFEVQRDSETKRLRIIFEEKPDEI